MGYKMNKIRTSPGCSVSRFFKPAIHMKEVRKCQAASSNDKILLQAIQMQAAFSDGAGNMKKFIQGIGPLFKQADDFFFQGESCVDLTSPVFTRICIFRVGGAITLEMKT